MDYRKQTAISQREQKHTHVHTKRRKKINYQNSCFNNKVCLTASFFFTFPFFMQVFPTNGQQFFFPFSFPYQFFFYPILLNLTFFFVICPNFIFFPWWCGFVLSFVEVFHTENFARYIICLKQFKQFFPSLSLSF